MQTLTREVEYVAPKGPRRRRTDPLELHASKVYPAGRECARFDCITVLCRYNPGPTCWIHTHDEFRPMASAVA